MGSVVNTPSLASHGSNPLREFVPSTATVERLSFTANSSHSADAAVDVADIAAAVATSAVGSPWETSSLCVPCVPDSPHHAHTLLPPSSALASPLKGVGRPSPWTPLLPPGTCGPGTSRHMAAESRRRARINERLDALRTLVPHTSRANTATFLGEVYQYIEHLHAELGRGGAAHRAESLVARDRGRKMERGEEAVPLFAAAAATSSAHGTPADAPPHHDVEFASLKRRRPELDLNVPLEYEEEVAGAHPVGDEGEGPLTARTHDPLAGWGKAGVPAAAAARVRGVCWQPPSERSPQCSSEEGTAGDTDGSPEGHGESGFHLWAGSAKGRACVDSRYKADVASAASSSCRGTGEQCSVSCAVVPQLHRSPLSLLEGQTGCEESARARGPLVPGSPQQAAVDVEREHRAALWEEKAKEKGCPLPLVAKRVLTMPAGKGAAKAGKEGQGVRGKCEKAHVGALDLTLSSALDKEERATEAAFKAAAGQEQSAGCAHAASRSTGQADGACTALRRGLAKGQTSTGLTSRCCDCSHPSDVHHERLPELGDTKLASPSLPHADLGSPVAASPGVRPVSVGPQVDPAAMAAAAAAAADAAAAAAAARQWRMAAAMANAQAQAASQALAQAQARISALSAGGAPPSLLLPVPPPLPSAALGAAPVAAAGPPPKRKRGRKPRSTRAPGPVVMRPLAIKPVVL